MSEITIDPAGMHLLVVDGDPSRRAGLLDALAAIGYGAVVTADSVAGITSGPVPPTDLALVDIDGSEASQNVRRLADALPSTPLIGVTSDSSPTGRRRAAELRIDDFVLAPIEPSELRMRVSAALSPVRLRRLLADRSARLTEALRYRTAELGTVQESLSLLAAVADFHDDDTDQHGHRVGLVSAAIGRALELPEQFVAMLADAAPLHDIGKVGVSRRILLKPGKLSPSEWLHMQQHVEIGGQILAAAQSPVLMLAGEIARTHHEHWDGNGYTAGLAGKEIPLSGRIVAVADVWDTLTHDRPYRQAWDHCRAADEIRAQAGAHFDPTVVAAFSALDHASLSQPDGADRDVAA